MPLNRELRAAIDTCRPGKDDLSLPALAELAAALPGDVSLREELARSQQFDIAVAAALNDLPVPSDLAERLLSAAAKRDVELPPTPATDISNRPFSRRAWHFAAASAAAILLAVSLGSWFWNGSPHEITPNGLAADLEAWMKAAAAGRRVTALPGGYRLPANLLTRPLSYQRFTTRQGWPAIAVNLSSPPGPASTLFILRSRATAGLAAVPRSIGASGGKTAVAWQTGDLVYVLVIERGQRIEDYLAPRHQA